MIESKTAAETLMQALPYVQRLRDQAIVVKLGGSALADEELSAQLAKDVVLMQSVGVKPVIVHGGGPQITTLMSRLGMATEFKDGHRITDAESLEVTRMVLTGKVNRELVTLINRHGPIAVGISGEDAGLLLATERHPELGFVGDVEAVNPHIIHRLLAEDLVPVVSTIGTDAEGQAYNINADAVAGALAGALGAAKVVYLTDVEGLRMDVANPSTLVRQATADQLRQLLETSALAGGMIPKVTACIDAIERGVGSAHILDATIPHALLIELFTDDGIGTMVTAS
ncbi:MAG: acetylglutamate kinase [Acidimicrobiia bacterium]